MDTHTAVAYAVYQEYKEKTHDDTKTVIVSTASPYKFTHSVMTAVDSKFDTMDDFKLLEEMKNLSNVAIPNAVDQIQTRPIRHNIVCEINEMKDEVRQFLTK